MCERTFKTLYLVVCEHLHYDLRRDLIYLNYDQ